LAASARSRPANSAADIEMPDRETPGISASAYQGYSDLRRGTPLPAAIGSFYNTTLIAVSSL